MPILYFLRVYLYLSDNCQNERHQIRRQQIEENNHRVEDVRRVLHSHNIEPNSTVPKASVVQKKENWHFVADCLYRFK